MDIYKSCVEYLTLKLLVLEIFKKMK